MDVVQVEDEAETVSESPAAPEDEVSIEGSPNDMEKAHSRFADVITLAHEIQSCNNKDIKSDLEAQRSIIESTMDQIAVGTLDGVLKTLDSIQEELEGLKKRTQEDGACPEDEVRFKNYNGFMLSCKNLGRDRKFS